MQKAIDLYKDVNKDVEVIEIEEIIEVEEGVSNKTQKLYSYLLEKRKELDKALKTAKNKEEVEKTNKSIQLINENQVVIKNNLNEEIIEVEETQNTDTGTIKINGKTFYYITKDSNTKYFNRWGELVDKKGKILSTNSSLKKNSQIIEIEEIIEIPSDVLPPPPPLMKNLEDNISNQSEELQKAWKAFKTEGDKYGNAVNNYLTNKEGTISALKKQYKEVMKLYNTYHDIVKIKKTNTLPPPPPPPARKSNKNGPQVDDVIEVQQKATPEQIAEYNTLAKKISKNPHGIIKSKDVNRIKYLYGLMTKEQKEKYAESFPKFAPPPPPPAMDTISTYNSLAKRTKLIPNNRKNNIQYLKVLFNKMSNSNKEKVESPNRISKYIAQLDNLTAEQVKKVNAVYNKIKASAQSKGRKFYTTAEYKELEKLYASML